MLRQRFLSGVVLAPIVIGAVYLGGWAFFTLVLIATLLAGNELYSLLARNAWHPAPILGLLMMAGFVLGPMLPEPDVGRLVLAAGIILSLLWQISRPLSQRSLSDWALTISGAVYIGWLGSFMVAVRQLPDGLGWTLVVLLGTWMNDSAAYLTGVYLAGRFLGRHPFSPTISPKKTWEGSIAGWIVCTVVIVALSKPLGAPLLPSVGLGMMVGILGSMGDLSVSVIKRRVGAKDSGNLIPGHGGMLDRVDSLLFVAVIVYYFIVWVVQV